VRALLTVYFVNATGNEKREAMSPGDLGELVACFA
jgi:hypothetical protein